MQGEEKERKRRRRRKKRRRRRRRRSRRKRRRKIVAGGDGSEALQEVLADLKILLEIKHENYCDGIDLKYRRGDIER